MSNYRRHLVAGGTYFFTTTLLDRRSDILTVHVEALREAVRLVQAHRPFHIDAWVVLPDHMHCIWTLPAGDSDYSGRWRAIKSAFSKSLVRTERLSATQMRRSERGIWQRRFWEHTIRDERDYAAHVDYVYVNPFKHGLVQRVRDWPYSSFHRDVALGLYPEDWVGDAVEMEAGEREAQHGG